MNQTADPPHPERPHVPSQPPTSLQWTYVACCLLILIGGAAVGKDRFGTHHLTVHLAALGLAAGWFLLPGTRGPGQPWAQLGLQGSFQTGWIGLALALGMITGVTRFVTFRLTGQGGLALYEAEFVRYFTGENLAEALPRAAVFLLVLYLSVLVPGLLFCGIIQETFRRGGYFVCGLMLQAAVFGFIHAWMTGSFDFVYGSETFLGAIVYGLLFHAVRNLYVPSLFFWAHVATATLLLAW